MQHKKLQTHFRNKIPDLQQIYPILNNRYYLYYFVWFHLNEIHRTQYMLLVVSLGLLADPCVHLCFSFPLLYNTFFEWIYNIFHLHNNYNWYKGIKNWQYTCIPVSSEYTTGYVMFMVFNTTFNNISVISWQLDLLVEESGVPGGKKLSCRFWINTARAPHQLHNWVITHQHHLHFVK